MKRFSTFFSTLFIVAALLITAGQASKAQTRAEDLPELSRDWTLRLGAWIPKTGSLGISAHAERRVYKTDAYDLNMGMGYNGSETVYNVPILFSLIYHIKEIRAGALFGYSFGKRVDGRGMSGTALGLLAGYRIKNGVNPITADVRYLWIAGADSELDGWSITVGIGF